MKTFEGIDTRAGFSYRYAPDTGLLSIGCTDLTVDQWRLQGEERIQSGIFACEDPTYTICARNVRRREYARVALPKLLDEIEAAEAPEPIVYNESRPQIVLDKDVYDTLELSALAFGGIGAGRYGLYFSDDTPCSALSVEGGAAAPYCAVGHEAFSGIGARDSYWNLLPDATVGANDRAVRAINRRKGKSLSQLEDRVSFAEWVGELNVRRGDA